MARRFFQVWTAWLKMPILLVALLVGQTAMAQSNPPSAVADKSAINQELHKTIVDEHTGFKVGKTTDGGGPTYVFFDPQCNHCLDLWQQAKPLNNTYQLTWVPVNLLGEKSLDLGAALIESKTPGKLMDLKLQDSKLTDPKAKPSAKVADVTRAKVKANLALLKKLGFDSVPLVVRYNEKTKTFSADLGSMTTAGIESLLKIQNTPANQ